MAKLLRMPEVAANVEEAVLQEWTVPDNTPFAARDAIATVETDKALVDVEATEDGVILKQLVPAGRTVQVGAPIAVLGAPGERVDDAVLAELGVGEARAERKFASPLARRLAREAGLTVADITGTGPGGRVVRRDVEQAAEKAAEKAAASRQAEEPSPHAEPAAPEPAAEPAPEPAVPLTGSAAPDTYTEIPHSRTRRTIAARLTESKNTAPHFYLRATIRAGKLLRLRDRLNEHATVRISVTDLLVKAAAVAHTRVPEMNVTWTPDAVRSYSAVDISVAVATDRGLLTPVVRGVDGRSISSLAAATHDLAARARAGRLRQEELDGGTLTVTNLGMYGTEEFAAIINPPQAAILAVGAARREPVVRKGQVRTATVIRCTLSVDHRPVDGVVAARWLDAFVGTVEHPMRILT